MPYCEGKILKAKWLRKKNKDCDWEKKKENRTLKKIFAMRSFITSNNSERLYNRVWSSYSKMWSCCTRRGHYGSLS